MSVEVSMSNGGVFIVDPVDRLWVGQFNWCRKDGPNASYAMTYLRGGTTASAHQFVMSDYLEVNRDCHIDHIDGDGLNNRRNNLRLCTRGQNRANTRNGKNKVIGVCFENGSWRAYIGRCGRAKSKRGFKSQRDAAAQYNIWAKDLYGEFAKLNNLEEIADAQPA